MTDWPPPYEYLGRPTAWTRLVREYGDLVPHTHPCIECYEHVPCNERCTLEPDLENEGIPSGCHMMCSRCTGEYFKQEQERLERREQLERQRVCVEQLVLKLGA